MIRKILFYPFMALFGAVCILFFGSFIASTGTLLIAVFYESACDLIMVSGDCKLINRQLFGNLFGIGVTSLILGVITFLIASYFSWLSQPSTKVETI